MSYQIMHFTVPKQDMTRISGHEAQAVVILAMYGSTNPKDEVLCVPLTKRDFEDQQFHPACTKEKVKELLPEYISYNPAIYQNCLDQNDCTTVRFDEDIMDWVPGPHPWAQTMEYMRKDRVAMK